MKCHQGRRTGERPPRAGWARVLGRGVLLVGAWAGSSCAPSGFASETLVTTVRILASGSDPAYAQPGSTVTVQVLAVDGRPAQPEPMTLFWLPVVCEDPADDAYFACFQGLGRGDAGAAPDGGAISSGLDSLPAGADITSLLPTGPSHAFQVPSDVVSQHTAVAGELSPYGLAIVFNIACAGHSIKLLPADPTSDNPQRVPIGCFDENGNQLGPDDSVFGFSRIYAFAPDAGTNGTPITNANPTVASVDVDGTPLAVALTAGMTQVYSTQTLTLSHCAADGAGCADVNIGPVVPESSWEVTQQTDVNGNPQHEEIWADFYSSFGKMSGSATLLYDANKGSIGDPAVTDLQFSPPGEAGSGFIWIVVHDNRGGASWVTIPVEAQ
jgi:hypothetical protein